MEKEIFHLHEQGFSLVFSKGQWKVKESSEQDGYGIRVLEQGKLGFSYCQNKNELDKAIERARQLAAFSPKTNFSFSSDKNAASVQCADKKLKTTGPKELKQMLDEVREGTKGIDQVRIYANVNQSSIAIENEHINKQYEKTEFDVYVEATKKDGAGHFYYGGIKLPEREWQDIGKEAAMLAKQMQGAGKPKSGKYDVIFSTEALHDLLGILLPSFSGDWKRRKITALAGKEGKKIVDEKFSLYDDGTADASGIRPWDGEGMASRRIALIENGIVKNFLYDRETAALENIHGEGSCERDSYYEMPHIASSNLIIMPGKIRDIKQDGEYLYIKSLHGTHTANTTTGDFGVEISTAFHTKGNKQKPMRGFLISDNIFSLLNRIKEKGEKIDRHGNLIAPEILFKGIQIVS